MPDHTKAEASIDVKEGADAEPYFSMGADTLKIPLAMHRDHRQKLAEAMLAKKLAPEGTVIFLRGGDLRSVYDSDTDWDFKQESYFQYLFGVKEPGCLATIQLDSSAPYMHRSTLYIPRFDEIYATWMGPIKPKSWFQSKYLVDEVQYADEIDLSDAKATMEIDGINRDSGIPHSEVNKGLIDLPNKLDGSALWDVLNELRSVKDEQEIKIMEYACQVSSSAHLSTMRACYRDQDNEHRMEYNAVANFRYEGAMRGCERVGYGCIGCSGTSNASLHYGHPAEPNDKSVHKSDLRLLDMGAEYHCYTADVTCTFPTSGKFTELQKEAYESVLAAVHAVEGVLRPGLDYREMHRKATRVIAEELTKRLGLFTAPIDAVCSEALVSRYLMPHGLGHMLGLDCHDVGGYEPGHFKDKDDVSLTGLRLGRVIKEGFVLTVEPGCYFNPYLIDKWCSHPVHSKMVDEAVLKSLIPVGGIRIEDDVLITRDGCRVLNDIPRSVEDIEAYMQGRIDWIPGEGKVPVA
ncbi:hypothetical protein FOZ60_001574 [Perkinsus olseni]|uniref:Xaa-Pro dipeptidase n=1 Tax=Perkinsus olseni TaxID=32597 RepID=A0A7J6P2J5_PEROL|nr:hypothetical protein FOZ60_001574 [Perkinsus olseni]